ncbi:hypothetical protein ACFLV3_01405 [Chloroflexota bacterium]
MAQEDKSERVEYNPEADIEQMERHLDMLDNRLDNIDSLVTAVAERVLSQPIAINITCPSCGKNIEIALLGSEKPTK